MKTNLQLAFIFLAVPAIFSGDHRYCELESCPNRTNTLCKYTESGQAEKCGNVVRSGLTGSELRLLLQIYNRNLPVVTLHEQDEYLEPAQTHINAVSLDYMMQWDEELAEIAQRWADQCINTLDECRNVERFRVRQRVGVQMVSIHEDEPLISHIISRWFIEDRSTRLDDINFFRLSYEQVLNLASDYFMLLRRQADDRIGCGTVRSYDDEFQYLYIVCNYGLA